MKRGCITCAYARFEATPTGKPKRNQPIVCRAPVPSRETVIAALRPVVPASMIGYYGGVPHALAMWPYDGDDGSDCAVWTDAAMEGTP